MADPVTETITEAITKTLTSTSLEIETFTTTEASTSTRSADLHLTTPFVAPDPKCHSIFSKTVITDSFWWNVNMRSISTLTAFVSDSADLEFQSCMPEGWDPTLTPSSSRFVFSPAVCPESWTMYRVMSMNAGLSTGYCCAPGYKFHMPLTILQGIMKPGCFSDPSETSKTNIWDWQQDFEGGTLSAHNPWNVMWAESDLPSMSPKPPPNLTKWSYDSWPTDGYPFDEDGNSIPTSTGIGSGGNFNGPTAAGVSRSSPALFLVLVTVIPAVGLIAATWALVHCCRIRRKRRREEQAAFIVERELRRTGKGVEGDTEAQTGQVVDGEVVEMYAPAGTSAVVREDKITPAPVAPGGLARYA
ncbi:hypothetical protein QBC35DRAFT_48388 [Podospora australis]|uniref:Uncharacterized protein n=1 Tax=Podospora australis TaxID=1536484 RepID=A0AAN6WMX5_9PEZI|nr:hypothetical protein QBC35DRAFT_48388 [Podospora australis]